MQRAGTNLYNTLTIIEEQGYNHRPQPIPHTVPLQQPRAPEIPAQESSFWSMSPYYPGVSGSVIKDTHVLIYLNSRTKIDNTNIYGGGSLTTYDPAALIPTNMTVTPVYTATLGWGVSQHNNPETYYSGEHTIQVLDCVATADNASVIVDPATSSQLYVALGFSLQWIKPRPITEEETLGVVSLVAQVDDEANTIGPVATENILATFSPLLDDMVMVCGPAYARVNNNIGAFTSFSAVPDLNNWGILTNFGYSMLTTEEEVPSSIGATFVVNDPGGADGHHETFDSAFVVGMVFRHE